MTTAKFEGGLRAVSASQRAAPARTAQRVIVHVGEPKTGTTFLQQVMWRNRSELAVAGVMLPGPRPLAHWRAAQDLREVPQLANDPVGPFKGAWDRLARQALRAPRVGVISHELLAAATAEAAARAVRSLAPAEVHVVLTVRDLATLLPAEWQESVKHRTSRGWDDWLGDVIDRESVAADRRQWWFWRVHDTMEILRIWSQHVPVEHVHVITTPPRGSSTALLWERFAGLLGVDPATVDTTRARANSSLGLPEVELLRRVNEALPETVPNWSYMRNVKETLAHGTLAARPTSGRLELPPEREAWALEQARTVVERLRASRYDIIGDLEELIPRPISGPRAHPADVTAEQMLDAAVDAVTGLLSQIAASQGVTRQPPAAAAPPATRARAAQSAAKQSLISLSERSPAAHAARRGYWHAVNTLRRIRAGWQREHARW